MLGHSFCEELFSNVQSKILVWYVKGRQEPLNLKGVVKQPQPDGALTDKGKTIS